MNPEKIIEKYYNDNDRLRTILTVHSRLVADKALEALRIWNSRLADQAGSDAAPADLQFAEEAAMLHDIGIYLCDAPDICCYGKEPYIRHGVMGREILDREGYPRHALVCERHTGAGLTVEDIDRQKLPLPRRDMTPRSVEERAICYADKFYSKSGDIRREKSLAKVIKSMARHGRGSLERFLRLHTEFAE